MTAANKTQTKIQAWSSLVFHCCHSSFNPSEAPPWDSRPVSGAGVVHYQLLHRPRSVPTALGPAPLATSIYMFNCNIMECNWIIIVIYHAFVVSYNSHYVLDIFLWKSFYVLYIVGDRIVYTSGHHIFCLYAWLIEQIKYKSIRTTCLWCDGECGAQRDGWVR